MLSDPYKENIYKVIGEKLIQNPNEYFDEKAVYLVIDKDKKLIWIWAGEKSKLFHKYIASTLAGKLKSKKKYYDFKYEVISQGREPADFITIFNEINQGRMDLNYPGESRTFKIEKEDLKFEKNKSSNLKTLTGSEKSKIKKVLGEIMEMQMHIKYSIDHINKRIMKIKKIVE